MRNGRVSGFFVFEVVGVLEDILGVISIRPVRVWQMADVRLSIFYDAANALASLQVKIAT